jgi:signal peptidase I
VPDRLLDRLLDLGAGLGAVCIVAALAGTLLGVTPLVFRSGSMAPAIETGALALARTVPAADLRVGDVVSVRDGSGTRITHRIESIERDRGRTGLVLKGDANMQADAEPYVVETAERVFLDIRWLGYAVARTANLPMVVAAVLLVGAVLLTGLRRRAAPVGAVLMAVAVGGASYGSTAEPTLAAWGDVATTTSGSYSASVVPAPALSCGALSLLTATFDWGTVADATSYTLHWNSGADRTTVPGTTATVPVATGTHTAWVQANRDFSGTTWTSSPSNEVTTTTLEGVGTCT